MQRSTLFGMAAVAALLLLFIPAAHASPIPPTNVLDGVVQTFHDNAITWGAKANGYATRLFLGLAIIGLIWNCGWLALQREDLGAFFSTFIRWLLFVGFFWWLTQNAAGIASSIISSFRLMGADIANLPGTVGPSTPLDIAFKIDQVAGNSASMMHPFNSLALYLVDLVTLIALCCIAANMLITLCKAWILIYAGQIVLGFGAVKWTSDIAINYFRTVLGISVTYMTMILLVGMCVQVFNGLLAQINTGTATMQSLEVVCAVAIVLAFVVHIVPPWIGGLTGNHGGAHGSLGVGAAIGAAVAAGAAIATGGASVAASGAASAAGAAASGAAGSAGGGGALGPIMNATRAGGSSGGDGVPMTESIGPENDSDSGAPLASTMGDGSRPPTRPGGGSFATRARAFAQATSGIAHAGISAMDQAVGGSGYNGALAPGTAGSSPLTPADNDNTPPAADAPTFSGDSVSPAMEPEAPAQAVQASPPTAAPSGSMAARVAALKARQVAAASAFMSPNQSAST